MCSYQVWVKRGCPDSLVQSTSGQELLFQTLHLQDIVLQSLLRLNGMFCSHDEVECIRWSLGQHIWHRPPCDGEGVCSQSFMHFLTHLPFLKLGTIALIACSREVFALKFSKAVFKVLTKSGSKADWLHDALLSSEVPAGPDPSRHHMCGPEGITEEGRGVQAYRHRQTDIHTLPQNQKPTVCFPQSFNHQKNAGHAVR